jgi:CBS domain-containing protein
MPTVKDFMTKDVITIDVGKTVLEAAELMTQKGVGDLVVMDGKTPVGIVTERDFVRRVVADRKALDSEVSEIMTSPLWVIHVDNSLQEAARKMVARNIRRLPVLNKNELVGIITATDLARHLSKKTLTEEILEILGHYSIPDFLDKPQNPKTLHTADSKS